MDLFFIINIIIMIDILYDPRDNFAKDVSTESFGFKLLLF